jgi:plastocyanin
MASNSTRVRLGGVIIGAILALGVAGQVLAADASVAIQGFAFDPATVTVSAGDSVTWTNSDGVGHTATANGGTFDTGTIGTGGSRSVTFAKAGTFAYHCSIHPTMTGTIVVRAAGGPGSTTPPTDTDRAGPTPIVPVDIMTALLVAAGVIGLWLGGVFARDRIRRD